MTSILLFIFISIASADVYNGLTLFSPLSSQGSASGYTYLIDSEENIVNQWQHDCRVVSIAYLESDSSIIIPCTQNVVPGLGGNNSSSGGRILKYDWYGNVLWDDIFVEDYYQPHHDIEPLPNGNILFITYERKSYDEAVSQGRVNIENEMWPSMIIELQQVSIDSSVIVWEWHLWDHIIQDVDENKPNYGVVMEHPELLDINLGGLGGGGGGNNSGDWIHLNSIDYNEELDLIAISSRKMNELYFIDHSTTTEEAASHSGGNYGKGGDFVYRWGNPQNYDRGHESDQQLISQHSVNWIPEGYPGEGNIILFNNMTMETGSRVLEITIPMEGNNFQELGEGDFYLPLEPSWVYGEDESFFAMIQSGAFRLPNGNTLISLGSTARFFEIDPLGEIVWDYTFEGPGGQTFNGNIARAQKYHEDYLILFVLGDVNFDEDINILDVVQLVNLVLENDFLNSGDINSDETLDILDVILLVNMIVS